MDGGGESDKVQIEVLYWFSSQIVYDLNNMDCFLYLMLAPIFWNTDIEDEFDFCNLNMDITARGGREHEDSDNDDFCDFAPCIFHENATYSVRRLWATDPSDDGNVSMIIHAADNDTFYVLQSRSQSLLDLEDDFEYEFWTDFDVEMDVVIASSVCLYFDTTDYV